MNKFPNNKLHNVLIFSYALLLLAGAVMHILQYSFAPYLFAIGAGLAVIQSFLYAVQNKTKNIRTSRLHRLYFVASLFLVAAAVMMFMHSNSWSAMILIYALIVFFLSFRGNK